MKYDPLEILRGNGLMLEDDFTTTVLPDLVVFPHRVAVNYKEILAMLDRMAMATGHRFEPWVIVAPRDGMSRTLSMCFGNERDAIYAKMFLS